MSFIVALDSTTIFINMVGTKAILNSFIFDFPLSILIVIVTVL
jgi:hypothetical protein